MVEYGSYNNNNNNTNNTKNNKENAVLSNWRFLPNIYIFIRFLKKFLLSHVGPRSTMSV